MARKPLWRGSRSSRRLPATRPRATRAPHPLGLRRAVGARAKETLRTCGSTTLPEAASKRTSSAPMQRRADPRRSLRRLRPPTPTRVERVRTPTLPLSRSQASTGARPWHAPAPAYGPHRLAANTATHIAPADCGSDAIGRTVTQGSIAAITISTIYGSTGLRSSGGGGPGRHRPGPRTQRRARQGTRMWLQGEMETATGGVGSHSRPSGRPSAEEVALGRADDGARAALPLGRLHAPHHGHGHGAHLPHHQLRGASDFIRHAQVGHS